MSKFTNKIVNTVKSSYQLRKEKYKYDVGDVGIYLGGLYEKYKKSSMKILSRTCKKAFNYYIVEFEDGKQMELKENWIGQIEKETENET
jgi:hypothetical protein